MRPLSRWLRFGFWAVIFLFPKDINSRPGFLGSWNAYLPAPRHTGETRDTQAGFSQFLEDRQFHEQYKKLLGLHPTPLMPEEQQRLVAELPRY
jgi:hypothetical protein